MGVETPIDGKIICLLPEVLLGLLEEVGRHRALTDRETDLIEDIVAMDTTPFRWNPRLDGQLKTASHSPGGIARFARRYGITSGSAYQRLDRLRRKSRERASTRRGR